MATRGRKLKISPASRRLSSLKQFASYFPLNSPKLVVELFREQISQSTCPDLAVLSIILGAIEHGLTCDTPPVSAIPGSVNKLSFPVIQLNQVELLYEKFSTLLRDAISTDELASCRRPGWSTRVVVRKVSDLVWSYLHSSYQKDRAHMQSLYSLLNGELCLCYFLSVIILFCFLATLSGYHAVRATLANCAFTMKYCFSNSDCAGGLSKLIIIKRLANTTVNSSVYHGHSFGIGSVKFELQFVYCHISDILQYNLLL